MLSLFAVVEQMVLGAAGGSGIRHGRSQIVTPSDSPMKSQLFLNCSRSGRDVSVPKLSIMLSVVILSIHLSSIAVRAVFSIETEGAILKPVAFIVMCISEHHTD